MLALATQLKEMKALQEKQACALATASSGNGGGRPSGNDNQELVSGLPKWRTIEKEPSKVVNGTTYYWCPHHKHKEGLWDGLYVRHPPEKHDEADL